MTIDYDHQRNLHTLQGPRLALPIIFPSEFPRSVLDVGCGTGTWLRAAIDLGAGEILGIDGVPIAPEDLLFDARFFNNRDLTTYFDLGRKFDVALCLEVAEHLDEQFAPTLIATLTRHSDYVVFSAACPNQPGQHHVNCQWPSFWQGLFNEHGFACYDDLRWKIWDNEKIEPWYRQNLFTAKRIPDLAGREARIRSVIHPEIAALQIRVFRPEVFPSLLAVAPAKQYPRLFAGAIWSKIAHKISRL